MTFIFEFLRGITVSNNIIANTNDLKLFSLAQASSSFKASIHIPGLKPGRVVHVNQVTFYLGQVGLTRFIKYPGLTWIIHLDHMR